MFGLSIRTILFSLLGVLTLTICGQGVIAVNKASVLNANIMDIGTNWMPSVDTRRARAAACERVRNTAAEHIVTTDEAGRRRVKKQLKVFKSQFPALRKRYEP